MLKWNKLEKGGVAMNSYLLFWKRAFDFKGKSSVNDFKIPFNIHLLLAFIIFPFIHTFVGGKLWTIQDIEIGNLVIPIKISSWALYLYTVTYIPALALSMRRYHDLNEEKEKGLLFATFPVIYIIGVFMLLIAGQGLPDTSLVTIIIVIVLVLPVIWFITEWFKLSHKNRK
ncbi:DUF805 domain-containing protein [Macrococcoides canis]|nr:DUF805 domain-containing protein [Macrococcus canis]